MTARNARSITIRVPAGTYEVLTKQADDAHVTLESFVEARVGDLVSWVRHQEEQETEEVETKQEQGMALTGAYL